MLCNGEHHLLACETHACSLYQINIGLAEELCPSTKASRVMQCRVKLLPSAICKQSVLIVDNLSLIPTGTLWPSVKEVQHESVCVDQPEHQTT